MNTMPKHCGPRAKTRGCLFGGAVLALFTLAGMANASPLYVWLQPGKTPGEAVQASANPLMPLPSDGKAQDASLVQPRAFLADGKALPATAKDGGFAVQPPTSGSTPTDLRFTARTLDPQGKPVYYSARLGRTETQPASDLELVPTEPGGATFRLFYKGKPVSATQVNVETSAGWRRTLRPAADGSVSLVSPEYPQLFPSQYLLEASARVTGQFEYEGKTFDAAVFTTTLSFEVPR